MKKGNCKTLLHHYGIPHPGVVSFVILLGRVGVIGNRAHVVRPRGERCGNRHARRGGARRPGRSLVTRGAGKAETISLPDRDCRCRKTACKITES